MSKIMEITLSKGHIALVDETDYPILSGFNWCSSRGYAQTSIRMSNGLRRSHLMHRLIMDAPAGTDIDHIDLNGHNNTRANLRLATRSENCRNTGPSSNNKSGYKGVYWEVKAKRWRAQIRSKGQFFYLGYFPTAEDAALAYNEAAKEILGEFAWLNIIERGTK